ncbi:hypothetical protein PQX77_022075 [Marasmius sp. AFHP31]|nr:hypothetical protein PQX77_022075 [Marasmius sp. AFHP31]
MMVLRVTLKIFLTLSLILTGAKGFRITNIHPFSPVKKPETGSMALVPWSRESTDPTTFEFVWTTIDSKGLRETGVIVNVTNAILFSNTQVPYPESGHYHLAIYGVPFASTNGPLFTSDQEVTVENVGGASTLISSGPSAFPATEGQSTVTLGVTNSGSRTIVRSSTKTILSFDSSSTTTESQPHAASQNHISTPAPVAPIVGGVIGGVLTVGLILFVLRWRLQRGRSQAQGSLDIEPFPTYPSKPKVPPPESGNSTPQQHSATHQDDIAARYTYRDPDAKVEHQPLVHPRYAEDTSSTTPAVQNGLDGTNVAPVTFPRPGIEVFTTDELAFALNQRLQEEGRWDIDETLPGYPDSSQGRSC